MASQRLGEIYSGMSENELDIRPCSFQSICESEAGDDSAENIPLLIWNYTRQKLYSRCNYFALRQ
jgi:hypothetical protein